MKLLPRIILTFGFTVLLSLSIFAQDKQWRGIPPAELAMKTPVVEPDADAEAIFWEVQLDDKKSGKLSYNHYVRVKIFTERGRERFSKFDIPFAKGKKVEEVAARVIKPDGTIVELKPEDIFEREIIKVGKIKIQAKSFAVPGIEPGVIVEYRYKETFKGNSADGERLVFQRDIPMQRASYAVRPFKGTNLQFSYHNMPDMKFVKNDDDFFVGTLTNVPALKEEELMPPQDEVRHWVAISYRTFGSTFSWNFFGRGFGQYLGEAIKPNKAVKQKAAELTANASTPDEKLKRLYEFTQKQIKNVSFDPSINDDQLENIKIKDADDVLKNQIGNSRYINLLFASLAKSEGFAVAMIFSADRSENFFDPKKDNGLSYVHPAGVAVIVDNKWKYFDPGIPYLPYGRMLWYEESSFAMLIGETDYEWREIPLSDYKQSPARRKGNFKLLEDGALEGFVRIEYEGHQAEVRRSTNFKHSQAKREESVKKEVTERISTAEISNISIENFENPALPLTYIFKVRIPNYAQKTGKRLFLQPGFFEYGSLPAFSTSVRKHNIYFSYPWLERDTIEIELPKGFSLENADAPAAVADPSKIGALNIKITIFKETNILKYDREFYFGGNGEILFPVAVYQPMKNLFDLFHKADTHTITLRQN